MAINYPNWTGRYGRGQHLNIELQKLVTFCEQHPQSAQSILDTLVLEFTDVIDTITFAINNRDESSGPGGGPISKPATAILMSQPTATLGDDATLQLSAIVTPPDADGTTIWSSDNETLATVSATGLVTAGGVGTSGTVTITATRGSVSDDCVITKTTTG